MMLLLCTSSRACARAWFTIEVYIRLDAWLITYDIFTYHSRPFQLVIIISRNGSAVFIYQRYFTPDIINGMGIPVLINNALWAFKYKAE